MQQNSTKFNSKCCLQNVGHFSSGPQNWTSLTSKRRSWVIHHFWYIWEYNPVNSAVTIYEIMTVNNNCSKQIMNDWLYCEKVKVNRGGWWTDLSEMSISWLCHDMETLSALQALCEGKPPVTGGFPPTGPPMWSFDVALVLTWTSCWTNSQSIGDLRRLDAHVTSL